MLDLLGQLFMRPDFWLVALVSFTIGMVFFFLDLTARVWADRHRDDGNGR